MRSPQLQHELSAALADADGAAPDLQIGRLRELAPGSAARREAPGVLLLEIDFDGFEDLQTLGQ